MKLAELAELLSGRIIGNADVEITGVKGIADAVLGDLTFFTDARYKRALSTTKASFAILPTNSAVMISHSILEGTGAPEAMQ